MATSQSDAVGARPSMADEMAKFSGFTTNNGETVDAKVEDLNPVAGKNISSGERQAGATTVAEARAAKVASPAAVVKAAAAAANADEKPVKAAAEGTAEADGEADGDDDKVVSLADAKAMAATAANKRVGKAVAKQRAA